MIKALPLRILGAGLLLTAMLVVLVVSEDRARAAGREVVLPVEALDPRELLTGHYVALRFVDRLPPGQACPVEMTNFGADGWVALRRVGDRHHAAGAGFTRESALKMGGTLPVRGSVICGRAFDLAADTEVSTVALQIGVDRYHADQDEAQAIDRLLAERQGELARAFAVISVGQDGRARLKGVILDGKRTDLTWW